MWRQLLAGVRLLRLRLADVRLLRLAGVRLLRLRLAGVVVLRRNLLLCRPIGLWRRRWLRMCSIVATCGAVLSTLRVVLI